MAGVLVLIDDWLRPAGTRRYPVALYVALTVVTIGFLAIWSLVGGAGAVAVAAPFVGVGAGDRLALALPAVARAARLLVWPFELSADYGPQVIPVRSGLSFDAIVGVGIVTAIVALGWVCRRR